MLVGGGTGQRGIKGEKWDNCSSIINKIYFEKKPLQTCVFDYLIQWKPISQIFDTEKTCALTGVAQ